MEIVFVCVSVHPTTMSFDTLWWLLFGQSDTHFQFASPNTNLEKSGNEGHSDNRLRADGISNEGQFILFEIYSDVVPLAIIILSPLHIFTGHLICTVNEDLKDTVVQWRMVNIVVAFPCKSCQCQARVATFHSSPAFTQHERKRTVDFFTRTPDPSLSAFVWRTKKIENSCCELINLRIFTLIYYLGLRPGY